MTKVKIVIHSFLLELTIKNLIRGTKLMGFWKYGDHLAKKEKLVKKVISRKNIGTKTIMSLKKIRRGRSRRDVSSRRGHGTCSRLPIGLPVKYDVCMTDHYSSDLSFTGPTFSIWHGHRLRFFYLLNKKKMKSSFITCRAHILFICWREATNR